MKRGAHLSWAPALNRGLFFDWLTGQRVGVLRGIVCTVRGGLRLFRGIMRIEWNSIVSKDLRGVERCG